MTQEYWQDLGSYSIECFEYLFLISMNSIFDFQFIDLPLICLNLSECFLIALNRGCYYAGLKHGYDKGFLSVGILIKYLLIHKMCFMKTKSFGVYQSFLLSIYFVQFVKNSIIFMGCLIN